MGGEKGGGGEMGGRKGGGGKGGAKVNSIILFYPILPSVGLSERRIFFSFVNLAKL